MSRAIPSLVALLVGAVASILLAEQVFASDDCPVAIVWPHANQKLADCSQSGAQYMFECDQRDGTFTWSVTPSGMGSFTNQSWYTYYTPLASGTATICLTRTCSCGCSTTVYQTVLQYTLTVTSYANGNYLVGRSREYEVMVSATGPGGDVPVTFRPYKFGEGEIEFYDPAIGGFSHEATISVPCGGTTDLQIKGTHTSSYVQDIEFDGRVIMRNNLWMGPDHPVEGIGVTRMHTVAICNISIDGATEENEFTQGAAVALNNNDDNNNGVTDLKPLEFDLAEPDPDLVKYTVDRLQPDDLTGTFRSQVQLVGGGGGIRLWGTNRKTAGVYNLGDAYPEDAVNAGLAKDRWIEGVSVGTAEKGTQIWGYLVGQGYTKSGLRTVEDLVSITVFGAVPAPGESDLMPTDKLFERGLTVCANRDDDDGDGDADYVNGGTNETLENNCEDDELYALRFTAPLELDSGDFTVTLPSGWEAFDDRKKTTKLTTITGPVGASGKTIYLEAKDLSTGVKDQEIVVTTMRQGRTSTMKIKATVGVVCGVQYTTQLTRWRYEVLFPASEGSPTITSQFGTVTAVPGHPRQAAIGYGNLGYAVRDEVIFLFPSQRKLTWKVDVFHLDIEEGEETAGSAPFEVGAAPDFLGVTVPDYHRHEGSTDSDKSVTMRYQFSGTSPRASNASPGGRYVYLGLIQNIKVTELQSTFRASSDSTVPDGTTLYNKTVVDGTASWYWDSLSDVRSFYDEDYAFDTLEATGGIIAGGGSTSDTPRLFVPILCVRTNDNPDAFAPGQMGASPANADPAPTTMGSIKSTSAMYDFRAWMAVQSNAQIIHASGTVQNWNVEQYYALTKGFWRMRVSGSNADGGYSWNFGADANHKNTCSKDTEPPPSALAKWTKLTSITQPTQSRAASFNTTFTDSFGDWHWERKN